jgi:FixJ family two-component response regulator
MPKASLVSVVEDDQFFRESMRRLMRSLGYSVETFPSAADFLASPLLVETACLIADVHMPAMTGLELHRHLIDAGYAIPTILVTAYPDNGVRARALNDGVVCYLGKPFDEKHLMRCLRAALHSDEPDGGTLVAAEIVHSDDVAESEFGSENPFDIGLEHDARRSCR